MSPDAQKRDSPSDAPVTPEHLDRIAETFDREYSSLLRWLQRRAPRADAEDILSYAFTQLLAQPYASVSRMAAYVWTTAENLLANYYRNKAVRCRKSALLEPGDSIAAPSPESTVIEQQRKDLLGRAVDRLDAGQRLALQLRLYEDLSTEEIAVRFAALGISVTERTVQRYLKQSYESCRQELETSEEPKKERSE